MTLPGTRITKLDGALGVLPATAGRMPAYVGAAGDGPIGAPLSFSRVKDMTAVFKDGPTVEAAAAFIDRWSRPVTIVRTDASADGTVGTVVHDSTGTSVVTADGEPADDYEIVLWFPVGGTVGTIGAQYRLSWDGGRNFDPAKPLGTANAIAAGGVTFHLAAGTIVAGDMHAAQAKAPQWNDSELSASLDVLGQSRIAWEILNVVGPMAPSTFDLVDSKITALEEAGKPRAWVGHVRMENPGETRADYRTALAGFAGKATLTGSLCAGAGKLVSGVSGRSYRRPLSYAYGALTAGVSEEVNVADVNVGRLVGYSITDVNGNPDEQDEALFPGLDDMRFVTQRTWGDAYDGVYITRPRVFAPQGSDFQIMPRVRVLAIARVALNAYFIRRLHHPIIVSANTGLILETEALEIEAGARAAMAAKLLGSGARKASDVQFKLSRTDNLLSNLTLTGDARVVGLAYPEQVNISLGYYNPAMRIEQVAA